MVETFVGIQIIAFSFALFMIYVSFLHYKQGNLKRYEFLCWLLLWLFFIYFALFPKVLDPILAKLFIVRRMDLLMIVAFMILAYLGFQNHIGVKSLQRQIEIIIRKRAHKNGKY